VFAHNGLAVAEPRPTVASMGRTSATTVSDGDHMKASTVPGPATAILDDQEFMRQADPFRRELLAHCYRLLGSLHDAEDVVQETYLRAWRSYHGFEGRSSLRQWLYRIATNACLRALEQGRRRPLPSGLVGASQDPAVPLGDPRSDLPWLQPIPDVLLGTRPDDPAAVVTARSSIRLAFVAALQHLSARQRAVLILRDVLMWKATEVADFLGTTTAAVNSSLQRARAQLTRVMPAEEDISEPTELERHELLDGYTRAFETADVAALGKLLRHDVELEMPPFVTWFLGREAVGHFFSSHILTEPGRVRMVPTAANGQLAAAAYLCGRDGAYQAHAVHVLSATPAEIARIVVFLDPNLFAAFGLPPSLWES
jgi:RNA polymerase sigma-70 factor (ECF subfamily)